MTLRLTVALILAVLFACAPVSADIGLRGWGVRVGVSDDPDQVLGGVHWDLGDFSPNWRFQPSVDAGGGDDIFSVSFNAMSAYYFDLDSSSVKPYAGGQVTASWFSYDDPPGNDDDDDTEVEVGLAGVGGIELPLKNGNRFLAEIQVGFGDIADFRVFAGWTF